MALYKIINNQKVRVAGSVTLPNLIDNVTLTKNAEGVVSVKDNGISLAKLGTDVTNQLDTYALKETTVNEKSLEDDIVLSASDIKATNTQTIQANLERIDENADRIEGRFEDLETYTDVIEGSDYISFDKNVGEDKLVISLDPTNLDSLFATGQEVVADMDENNKIQLNLNNTITNKINNSLQIPASITEQKLVSVDSSKNQQMIKIGTNLTLVGNVLSATGGVSQVNWGDIQGNLSEQADLNLALASKNDKPVTVEVIASTVGGQITISSMAHVCKKLGDGIYMYTGTFVLSSSGNVPANTEKKLLTQFKIDGKAVKSYGTLHGCNGATSAPLSATLYPLNLTTTEIYVYSATAISGSASGYIVLSGVVLTD